MIDILIIECCYKGGFELFTLVVIGYEFSLCKFLFVKVICPYKPIVWIYQCTHISNGNAEDRANNNDNDNDMYIRVPPGHITNT